eukprot:UN09554
MPIFLLFQCDIIKWYYIVFGLQMIWYSEIIIWYEIYQYFPDFPMRKIYPFTYNTLHHQYLSPMLSSTTQRSHIAMQTQNYESQKQYQHPQYVSNSSCGANANANSNVIALSPVSAASSDFDFDIDMDSNVTVVTEQNEFEFEENLEKEERVWVPKSDLEPRWGLVYQEYVAIFYGLLGGTLTCVSAWLIGRTLRHCVVIRQYKICMTELMFRYIF